jgi:hypothetical protein
MHWRIGSPSTTGAAYTNSWVELARLAGTEQGVEGRIVDLALRDDNPSEAELRRAGLRLSLARIESFLKTGAALAADLRAHLDDEEGEDDEDSKSEEDDEDGKSEEDDAG